MQNRALSSSVSVSRRLLALLLLAVPCFQGLVSCKRASASHDQRQEVATKMKAWLGEELRAWRATLRELEASAPTPQEGGWDLERDRAAIDGMRAAWLKARDKYERIEGAIAPTFPESDAATDARYDDFLGKLGPVGDRQPFDDQGVIGMHAVERILWPSSELVTKFERSIPGYSAPRIPGTEQEARLFRTHLLARLTRDVDALILQFEPLELDIDFAFQGLIDLAREQAEKVDKAATGQEESRYAQSTMRDLRMNHAGCLTAYRLFDPWLLSKPHGDAQSRKVLAAFERLKRVYDAVPGDAIPTPPSGFSGLAPRPEHLDTPFGELFTRVRAETDPATSGSLVHELYQVADALDLTRVVKR